MYRYEKKYIINNLESIEIQNRVKPLMKLDPMLGSRDYYVVRSMYFDDHNDTCLKQVLDGVGKRFKWRIRIYNYSDKYIVLEKKSKVNNITKKEACKLSRKQVEDILNNNIIIDDKNPKLLNELYILIKTKRYRPVVIIDYNRIPYVYLNFLIRVTIDSNITCSYDIDNFFSRKITSFPVNEDNIRILEVKYTSVLPDIIKYSLQVNSLHRTSYSKYLNARVALKEYVGGNL